MRPGGDNGSWAAAPGPAYQRKSNQAMNLSSYGSDSTGHTTSSSSSGGGYRQKPPQYGPLNSLSLGSHGGQRFPHESRVLSNQFDPAIGRTSASSGRTSASSSRTLANPPSSRQTAMNNPFSISSNKVSTNNVQGHALTWDSHTFARSGLNSRLGLFANAVSGRGPLEDVDETVARTPTEQRQRLKLQDLFTRPTEDVSTGLVTSNAYQSSHAAGDVLSSTTSNTFVDLSSNTNTISSVQSLPMPSIGVHDLLKRPSDLRVNKSTALGSPPGLPSNSGRSMARRGSTGTHLFNRGKEATKNVIQHHARDEQHLLYSNDSSANDSSDSFFLNGHLERNNLTLPLPIRDDSRTSTPTLLSELFSTEVRRPNSTGHLLQQNKSQEDDGLAPSLFSQMMGQSAQQSRRDFSPMGHLPEDCSNVESAVGRTLSPSVHSNQYSVSNTSGRVSVSEPPSMGPENEKRTSYAGLVKPIPNKFSEDSDSLPSRKEASVDNGAPPSMVTVPNTAGSQYTYHDPTNFAHGAYAHQETVHDPYSSVAYRHQPHYVRDLDGRMANLHLGPPVIASHAGHVSPQPTYVPQPDPAHYSPYIGAIPATYSPHHSPHHSPYLSGLVSPPAHRTPGHNSPQYFSLPSTAYGQVVGSPHLGQFHLTSGQMSPHTYPHPTPETYSQQHSSHLSSYHTVAPNSPQSLIYAESAQSNNYSTAPQSYSQSYHNTHVHGQPSYTPHLTAAMSEPQQYVVVQHTPGGQVVLAPASTVGSISPAITNGSRRAGEQRGMHYQSSFRAAHVPHKKVHHHPGGRNGIGYQRRTEDLAQPNCHEAPSLLEEFKRCHRGREWTVQNNVRGHVVEFCKDQNGSRFLQSRLDFDPTRIEGPLMLEEILQDMSSVKNDVFGNYVLQKLLEKGSLEMRDRLWYAMKGDGLTLSMQMYGCRVIQKAIETLPTERVLELVKEFHGHVVTLIEDQNGNHVCQKLIEVLSSKAKTMTSDGRNHYSDSIEFIVEDVLRHIARLSCHPYGCRVLQRMLEHCIPPQKERVLDQIAESRHILLDDQYGNYVIQHVLQYGRIQDREGILKLVLQRENGVLILSRQKFASNVVEKLLKYGTTNQRLRVLTEMLKEVVDDETEGPTAIVLLMVRDPYANYVVQTTLDVVPEGEERNQLIGLLSSNAEKLRNYTYAKHIVAKICQ